MADVVENFEELADDAEGQSHAGKEFATLRLDAAMMSNKDMEGDTLQADWVLMASTKRKSYIKHRSASVVFVSSHLYFFAFSCPVRST